MSEKYTRLRAPLDRGIEQAIVALKKGAHILKCGRRNKPKFCPFRLSTDESSLIWFSGEKEKQIKLKSITKIVLGQKTVNFMRHIQPEKESRSFSLIYQNGQRSLDLICKDEEQAESFVLGLTALLSLSLHYQPLANLKLNRGTQSCSSSPVAYKQTKYRLGLHDNSPKFSQARSLYGSPPHSRLDRFISDNVPSSKSSCHSIKQKTLSNMQPMLNELLPQLPHALTESFRKPKDFDILHEHMVEFTSPTEEKSDALKDVFMWGEGIGRFIGDDDNTLSNSDALVPKLLHSTKTLDVKTISCGEKHVAIATKQGEMFCWGEEKYGRLGHKISLNVRYPKLIESLNNVNIQKVSCGSNNTCAITNNGELYSWGGSSTTHTNWFPQRNLSSIYSIHVVSVACGEWHTALISSTEQLYTYGDGTFGALGHGNLMSVAHPKEVECLNGLKVKYVACGPWHTAAVVEVVTTRLKKNSYSGKLFTWGDGDRGQLGHSDKEKRLLPTCVASLIDSNFIQVSCGRTLTVALTVTGIVYTIGSLLKNSSPSISMVQGCLKSEFVKEISSGSFHVAALTAKGKLYTWGKGENGRLGIGDNRDRNHPTLVEALEGRNVNSVACGSSFTAVICSHKSVSGKDQLVCSKCQVSFGFARRKHNCYNCGLVFCHSCSSRKAMNASLAMNKKKKHRVCDACFIHLEKCIDSNADEHLVSPITPSSLTREDSMFPLPKLFSPKVVKKEYAELTQRKVSSRQDSFLPSLNKYQRWGQVDSFSPSSNKYQRWGQVSCPYQFSGLYRDNSCLYSPRQKEVDPDGYNGYLKADQFLASPLLPKTSCLKQNVSEIDITPSEELNRLRAEVMLLTEQCQDKSLKLSQYKDRVEEAWEFAKDEAAKCKAAKDVIKILSNQMNILSRRLTEEKKTEEFSDNIQTYTYTVGSPDVRIYVPTQAIQKHVSNVKQNTIPTKFEEEISLQSFTSAETNRQKGSTKPREEWVEEDEPGVFITLVLLPSGQKGLRRVRFSRRKFSDQEADGWWEENQSRVFAKYNIERIVTTDTSV